MAGSGKPGLFCSFRLIFALTALVGMTLLYILRQNIGVAVICMAHEEPVNKNHSGPQQCELMKGDGDIVRKDGPFNWTSEESGQVTFSFYYGYTALQIPGALLGSYIGPKMMITFTVAGSAAMVMAMPQAAYMGTEVLIVAQVLSGIAQSAAFPVMQTMIASWTPPEERSIMTAIVYTGFQLGPIVVNAASGYICTHLGWEMIFYIFGGLGIMWSIAWLILIGDSPETQHWMSNAEREYIMDSLADTKKEVTLCKVPWLKILLSRPFWALLVAQFCMDYGMYFFQGSLAKIYRQLIGVPIDKAGVYTAVGYGVAFLFMNITGVAADLIRKRGWLSTVNVRRIMMMIAALGLSVFTIALGFVPCEKVTLAVILSSAGLGLASAQYAGHITSYTDIAPAYSGIISSVTNTVSCAAGFSPGFIIGRLVKTGAHEEWQKVFYICAGITMFGAIVYCIFIQGEVQSWAIAEENIEHADSSAASMSSDKQQDQAESTSLEV
ncbi:Major Facilitator Superfamily protein [Aphelenchoides avenae]|nr:Major Facilitator Superfamily protein [Aphelenchus avenae]